MDIFSNSSLLSISLPIKRTLPIKKTLLQFLFKLHRVGIIGCAGGCIVGYKGALMTVKYKGLLRFKKCFYQDVLWLLLLVQACLLAPSVYALDEHINEYKNEPFFLSFYVNGYSLLAEMEANDQLLEKIATPINSTEQKHYRGVFSGYPNSSLRVSYSKSNGHGHWRGVLLFQEALYVVDTRINAMASSSVGIPAYQPDASDKQKKTCASGIVNDSSFFNSEKVKSHSSSSAFNIKNLISAPATVADVCANSINGICLLPEIELAYDLSYQNLPSAETPMQRALRELNEMELFFQDGLGYQFSRISLTMLNAVQDELIGRSDNPNDLLDRLRILRGSNQLDFLEQSRSIFHLVTGRDFSGSDGDVVGIAYLGQVCESFGLNTGLTDAGDTALVSLVMAHEIGHNLGADHDAVEVNGCPENRHVMSASLGFQASSFTGFSSCSIESINQTVADNLSGLCFNFPIDVGLTASLNNPVSPDRVTPFDLIYNINTDDGYIPIGSLNVSGVISNTDEGQFVSASIEGGVCTSMASSYNCTVNNPLRDFSLTVTATVNQNATELIMQHSVSSATAETTDVIASNNTLNVTLNSFGEPNPADDPVDEEPIDEEPIDDNPAEPDNTLISNGSSGGGGSMHPLGLLLLAGVYIFRQLRRKN